MFGLIVTQTLRTLFSVCVCVLKIRLTFPILWRTPTEVPRAKKAKGRMPVT